MASTPIPSASASPPLHPLRPSWGSGVKVSPPQARSLLLLLLILIIPGGDPFGHICGGSGERCSAWGQTVKAVEEDGKWPVPLLTFGMIADPHANINHRQPWWCDLACWRKELKLAASPKGRKHGGVLKKIEESVETLSRVPGISFSVNMGDLCDMDLMVNMPVVLDIWNRMPHPRYNLMGNHDLRGENDRFGEPAKLRNTTQIAWLLKRWGLEKRFFYSFTYPPFRFLVLDSMNLPPTAQGGEARSEQIRWLESQLEDSLSRNEDVIIFAHIPIGLNSNALRHTLTRYDHILAMFFGHKHSGGYSYHAQSGKHMITLQGMIETNTNAFSYVNVFHDRLELVGFGRTPSRVYFRSDKQRARASGRPRSAYASLLRRYLQDPRFFSQRRVEALIDGSAEFAQPYAKGLSDDPSQKPFVPLKGQGDRDFLKQLPVQRVGGSSGGGEEAQRESTEVRVTASPVGSEGAASGTARRISSAEGREGWRLQQMDGVKRGGVEAAVSRQLHTQGVPGGSTVVPFYSSLMLTSALLAALLMWVKRRGLRKVR